MKTDYFKIILVSAAVGLVAGVSGGILLVYSFNWYLDSTSLLSPRFLQDANGNQVVSLREFNKKITIEQDESLVEVIQGAKTYSWGIYKTTDNEMELVGQALALTSDGWLLARLPEGTKTADVLKWRAADKTKQSFAIDKVLVDNVSGFYFIALKDVKNLSVAKLGSANSLKEGHLLASVGWLAGSDNLYLGKKSRLSGLQQSEKSSLDLVLNGKPQSDKFAVVNLSGETVALINNQGVLVPMESVIGVMSSLLSGGQPVRPYLGAYYIDLSQRIGQGDIKGAVLAKNDKGEVLTVDSPLRALGLKSGDIIMAIDGIELDKDHDLTDIISRYKPKDKIYLRYKRGNTEKVEELFLGSK